MGASLGRITARLVQPADEVFSPDLVELINKNINPPTAVTKSDVYIGAMYVVSDEVNSFGGRFPVEEHKHLASLLVDSPVMAGHRKDRLPIGRNFHAIVVERDGKSWVKSYFYWLKSTEGAEALRKNIDGGIYKECSIGFTFLFPECSICKKDIRTCPHEPLQSYSASGDHDSVICHFNYRKIERVLETSLVYRGSVPDTSVSRELAVVGGREADGYTARPDRVTLINSLSELEPKEEYLLVPFYESLPVMVTLKKGTLRLRRPNGEPIGSEICSGFPIRRPLEMDRAYGHLVAYRGRERCSLEQLERYLTGRPSPVTRLEIKLFPPTGLAVAKGSDDTAPNRIQLIRHSITRVSNLDNSARSIMTRDGVRLWPLGSNPLQFAGYQYRPSKQDAVKDGSYTLTCNSSSPFATLALADSGRIEMFRISQFNLARLLRGGRFIADKAEVRSVKAPPGDRRTTQGQIVSLVNRDEGIAADLTGPLSGRFILRPARLDGQRRYLFYRIAS